MTDADRAPKEDVPRRDVDDARFMGRAATAIAAGMVLLLVGAAIGALAVELGSGPDVWKARVRLMSVSQQGLYGGVLIALGLLVALGLVRAALVASGRQGAVAAAVTAVMGASLWLGILMVLNIYVDVTKISPADVAVGTVLGDLAALVMLVVAGFWAFDLAGSKRR